MKREKNLLFKEFEKRETRKTTVIVALLVAIIFLLGVLTEWKSFTFYFDSPKKLNTLAIEELAVGEYYELELEDMYDYYATYGTEKEDKKRYYLTVIGSVSNLKYLTLEVLRPNFSKFNEFQEEYWKFYEGTIVTYTPIWVKGTLVELPSEMNQYYYNYFEGTSTKELDEYNTSYMLMIDSYRGLSIGVIPYINIVFIILVGLIIFFVVRRYIFIPELALAKRLGKRKIDQERIEDCVATLQKEQVEIQIGDLYITNSYLVLFVKGSNLADFIEIKDIRWIWVRLDQYFYGKISATKLFYFSVNDKNRNTIGRSSSEEEIRNLFEFIQGKNSDVLIGYYESYPEGQFEIDQEEYEKIIIEME